MTRTTALIIATLCLIVSLPTHSQTRFGEELCKQSDYMCITTKAGDTWDTLFPEPQTCDLVKRINRMNVALRKGMTIAVPRNIDKISIYDVSPFPRYIESDGEKIIFVDQSQLAFGAYDEQGQLVWWGPISSGSGRCGAIDGNCLTPSGSFRIIRKQDIDCISTVFPKRANGNNGGAIMPYCMHFLRGFALHGSESVPGYRDSHGCVRMFIEDARWLNEEFIELPGAGGMKGTRVIVSSIPS
jgi:hypothetical protein